jgi:hypothetical protein
MVETPDDLAAFTSPDEFGDFVLCEAVPFQAIVDRFHDQQRPAGTTNSSMGSFMVGAADMSITTYQALVTVPLPTVVAVEKTLSVTSGPHAGDYRIKDIQRDGVCTLLILNKR